jgi:mRNA interferase MazF
LARFVKGDVVIVPFPFSNLQEAKRRPALVITPLEGDDLILCQITSRMNGDRYSVSLDEKDFAAGSLKKSSNIRPNRLFTADQAIVLYRAGSIASRKVEEVVDRLVAIVRG